MTELKENEAFQGIYHAQHNGDFEVAFGGVSGHIYRLLTNNHGSRST